MVMKIKDEFYRDLGEKKEEKSLHEFMALAPEERKGTIRTLLLWPLDSLFLHGGL